MIFRQQILTKTDISILENIQKLDFVSYYDLAIEYSREKTKAKNKKKIDRAEFEIDKKKTENFLIEISENNN